MPLLPFKIIAWSCVETKTKCICWLFNDLLQETKCYGKYGLKRHYPFLLVNLIVSVEWVKVGSEPGREKCLE
jgi:hypothetical protein